MTDRYNEFAPAANKVLNEDGTITLLDWTLVDMTTATEKYKEMSPMANKFLNPDGSIVTSPRWSWAMPPLTGTWSPEWVATSRMAWDFYVDTVSEITYTNPNASWMIWREIVQTAPA